LQQIAGKNDSLIKYNFYSLIFYEQKIKSVVMHKKIIMDSINKNQPEKNKEDLLVDEGVKKIQELGKKAGSCFL